MLTLLISTAALIVFVSTRAPAPIHTKLTCENDCPTDGEFTRTYRCTSMNKPDMVWGSTQPGGCATTLAYNYDFQPVAVPPKPNLTLSCSECPVKPLADVFLTQHHFMESEANEYGIIGQPLYHTLAQIYTCMSQMKAENVKLLPSVIAWRIVNPRLRGKSDFATFEDNLNCMCAIDALYSKSARPTWCFYPDIAACVENLCKCNTSPGVCNWVPGTNTSPFDKDYPQWTDSVENDLIMWNKALAPQNITFTQLLYEAEGAPDTPTAWKPGMEISKEGFKFTVYSTNSNSEDFNYFQMYNVTRRLKNDDLLLDTGPYDLSTNDCIQWDDKTTCVRKGCSFWDRVNNSPSGTYGCTVTIPSMQQSKLTNDKIKSSKLGGSIYSDKVVGGLGGADAAVLLTEIVESIKSNSYIICSYEFLGQNIGTWLLGHPEMKYDRLEWVSFSNVLRKKYKRPIGVYWPVQAMIKWGFYKTVSIQIPKVVTGNFTRNGYDVTTFDSACPDTTDRCKPDSGGGGGHEPVLTGCDGCAVVTDSRCKECYNCNIRSPNLDCDNIPGIHKKYASNDIEPQFYTDYKRDTNNNFLGFSKTSCTKCVDPVKTYPCTKYPKTCGTCTTKQSKQSGYHQECQAYIGTAGDLPDSSANMRNQPLAYDKCLRLGCGKGCCLNATCVGCGYDNDGSWNNNISYIKFLNRPQKMAQFMFNMAEAKGNLATKSWRHDNKTYAWPMFSNEVAHNWYVTEDDLHNNDFTPKLDPYVVGASGTFKAVSDRKSLSSVQVTSANQCFNLQSESSDMCGTFDGFGIWAWPRFITFVQFFAGLTGISNFGLYAAQFIMPHWMNTSFKSNVYALDDKGNQITSQSPIKLHLYQGGWPDLNYGNGNDKLWDKIAKFSNQNNGIISSVYMTVDSANGYLTPCLAAKMFNTLHVGIVRGVIISANPKNGWVTPGSSTDTLADCKWAVGKGNTTCQNIQQKGGLTCSNWVAPTKGTQTTNSCTPSEVACYNTEYGGLITKPGCPNIIQNAVYYVSLINDFITKELTPVTVVGMDGENNGTAGAGRICTWWKAMNDIMRKPLETKYNKTVTLQIAVAFGGSITTEAIKKIDSCNKCTTDPILKIENLIALPETYWYVDGIKDDMPNCGTKDELCQKIGAGCNGCSSLVLGSYREAKTVAALSNIADAKASCCGGATKQTCDFKSEPCGNGGSCAPIVPCTSIDTCNQFVTKNKCDTLWEHNPTCQSNQCKFKPLSACAKRNLKEDLTTCGKNTYYLGEYKSKPGAEACPSVDTTIHNCNQGNLQPVYATPMNTGNSLVACCYPQS